MAGPIYALNLRDEYLAYSRRSSKEVQTHGGRVVALGRFREAVAGEIKPRSVMIVVEWTSKEAFDGYCNDTNIADLHPHRDKGACDYIWHLFDKLRPILKQQSLSRDQLNWQAGKLPQAVTELALRLADDVDPLDPPCECCHQHLGLEARQHLADA